jgi:hypothetical protein
VTGAEQQRIAAMFDKHAQLWWSSVVAEPFSFTKLVFQLGLNGERASNIETAGAIQLTRGNVHIKGSAVNFTDTGDRVCCQLQVRHFSEGRQTAMLDSCRHIITALSNSWYNFEDLVLRATLSTAEAAPKS